MLDGLIAWFLGFVFLIIAIVSFVGVVLYASSYGSLGWCILIGITGSMIRLFRWWYLRATTPPEPEPNPWNLPAEIPPMPVFDYSQFDNDPWPRRPATEPLVTKWVEDSPDALDD